MTTSKGPNGNVAVLLTCVKNWRHLWRRNCSKMSAKAPRRLLSDLAPSWRSTIKTVTARLPRDGGGASSISLCSFIQKKRSVCARQVRVKRQLLRFNLLISK